MKRNGNKQEKKEFQNGANLFNKNQPLVSRQVPWKYFEGTKQSDKGIRPPLE